MAKFSFSYKFQEFKIRFQIWWGNLSRGPRVTAAVGVGILGFLVLGLTVFSAVSYFKWNSKKMALPWMSGGREQMPEVSPGAARTEASPINGGLYTKEGADVFASRRPLAIMVNNHVQARPQFGLSKADLIYEAVAEGGITRLLAVFHAQDCEQVGPVRSARVYYEDWAAEFNAWYAHWGGAYMDNNDKANQENPDYAFTCNPAADAYAKINRINLPSLDQMWLGATAYWRDNSRGVATEHTGYTATEKLWNEAPRKYPGWEGLKTFDQWEFKEDSPTGDLQPAQALTGSTISFNFWETAGYAVLWEYDSAANGYKRSQGGEPTVDAGADNARILAKNVILQFVNESSFGDKKHHLNYETVGEGAAKVFLDGKVTDATWKKGSIYARTMFYDAEGGGIVFNRGQIWIEVIPTRNAGLVAIQ